MGLALAFEEYTNFELFPFWVNMRHFTLKEFRCRCACGRIEMDERFLAKLDSLRDLFGQPIIISSGFRCPDHNNRVSSTGFAGPHTTGKAADILVSGKEAHRLLGKIMKLGFKGVGICQKGEGRFIHVDDVESELRPWLWSY